MRKSRAAQIRLQTPHWRILALVAVLLIGMEREARAYTDPGTGAMIWQMLVAGVVGAAFYFRRFTTWFKNKGRKD